MNRKFDFPKIDEIPQEFRIKSEIYQNWYLLGGDIKKIDGKMTDCLSPLFLKTENGCKQVKLGEIPEYSELDSIRILNSSLHSYNKGNGIWQNMTFEQRIRLVTSFIERLASKKDLLVQYLMWETGKNHVESVHEVERTIEYTHHTIDSLQKLHKENDEPISDSGFTGSLSLSPVGVVLCMGPSNYPMYETYSIVLPALLMGNNVILKVPRLGALFHYFLFEDMKECFPPGTINILYGQLENTVLPIMRTGMIDMLAYFGNSTTANSMIHEHPSPNRLKLLLGLEAKNPAVVLDDCDFQLAVKETLLGALAFNGQRCAAIKIVYVHKNKYRDFVNELVKQVQKIPIGMPWDEGVRITPLSDASRVDYMKELINDAISKGAKLENEKGGLSYETLFYPAVITNVNESMRIYNEEQFGPIIPIIQFDNITEPAEYIRNSEFGQQISIFGNNPADIKVLTDLVKNQVSRININCKCQRGPDSFQFSGRKNSGLGVLSLKETLLSFSEQNIIAAKDSYKDIVELL